MCTPLTVVVSDGTSTARRTSRIAALPFGVHVVRVSSRTPVSAGCWMTEMSVGSTAKGFACGGSPKLLTDR